MRQSEGFTIMTADEFEKWLNRNEIYRNIKTIQHHHTWNPDYKAFYNNPNHFTWLKGMRDFHVNQRRFSDIAQHITTFPDGMIGLGRSFEKDPAGIKRQNKGAICIENLGNFDSDKMTVEQKECIIKITKSLCNKFKIKKSANTIVYHHWFDRTTGKFTNGNNGDVKSCPGKLFFGGNKVQDLVENFLPLLKNNQVAFKYEDRIFYVDTILKDDKNHVGARVLLENLGFKVIWNEKEKIIEIA